jgi:hypothetical protein
MTDKVDSAKNDLFDAKMEDMSDVLYEVLEYRLKLLQTMEQIENDMYPNKRSRQRVEIFEPYKRAVDRVLKRIDDKVAECDKFRSMPFSKIIDPATTVPYHLSNTDEHIIKGLLGEAYIERPVTVGTTRFETMYYTGYAIPSADGSIIPWMSGSLHNHKDDKFVAKGNTPEDLEMAAFKVMNNLEIPRLQYLKYEHPIYIQSGSVNSFWLIHDYNYRIYGGKYNDAKDYGGSWIFQKIPNIENTTSISQDSNSNTAPCIRYGDAIYIRYFLNNGNSNNQNKLWISVNDASEPTLVNLMTDSSERELYFKKRTSRWIVRGETDKSNGQCVQNLSIVYLQNSHHRDLHLSTIPGSSSRDIAALPYDSINQNEPSRWLLSTGIEKDGTTTIGLVCGVTSVIGTWMPIQSHETEGSVDNLKGVVQVRSGMSNRIDVPASWQNNTSWENSILESISGDLVVKVDSLYKKDYSSQYQVEYLSVDDFYGAVLAQSVKPILSSLMEEKSTNYTVPLFGQAWQFVFFIEDECSPVWTLMTDAVIIIGNKDSDGPCCLPGFEADKNQPHGPCRLSSPCFCSTEVCNRQTSLVL